MELNYCFDTTTLAQENLDEVVLDAALDKAFHAARLAVMPQRDGSRSSSGTGGQDSPETARPSLDFARTQYFSTRKASIGT